MRTNKVCQPPTFKEKEGQRSTKRRSNPSPSRRSFGLLPMKTSQGISPHIILISKWYDSYIIALIWDDKKGHHMRIISSVSYENHIILIWELYDKGIISKLYDRLYNDYIILIWQSCNFNMIWESYEYNMCANYGFAMQNMPHIWHKLNLSSK